MKHATEFKTVIDELIEMHVQNPVAGRAIQELVLTDLVESSAIDDEFGDELYDENGDLDDEMDAQVQELVTEYITSKLK